MEEVDSVLELAVRLAREAGAIQRNRYQGEFRVESKSVAVDLVTDVDRDCEAAIVSGIESARPGDAILAEEGGGQDRESADWRWIIDPLDGTTNYAHGYPRFCVSIGVEHHDLRRVAVVYDPLLDELYHAVQGGGAFLNGQPLRVSRETDLSRSLVATGFAYDRRSSREDNLENFGRFIKNARAVRRGGSAALDLCSVAGGRLEGYWELKLHAWDVAAGYLLVEEAGGRVSNLSGGPPSRDGTEVVASNGSIHEAMLKLLAAGTPS